MKIAIVHPSLALKGGAENVVVWFSQELARRSHSVEIFTLRFDEKLWPGIDRDSVRVNLMPQRLTRGLIKSKVLDNRFYGAFLNRELKRFDLVNPHNFPSHIWVWNAKSRAKDFPPCVWFCHEPLRPLYPSQSERHTMQYRQPEGVEVCINEHVLEMQKKLSGRVVGRKLLRDRRWDRDAVRNMELVLCNSVYTTGLVAEIYGVRAKTCLPGVPETPDGKEQAQATLRRRIDFLVIGSVDPRKNISNVMEALRILIDDRGIRDVNLVITGKDVRDSPSLGRYRGGSAWRVTEFVGMVSETELSELYDSCMGVVYIPLDEPFGLVPIEAMMHGKPVIASNHGGPSETVIHEETGFLVDPLNPSEIARAMGLILSNPEMAKEMGRQGRKHVLEKFTLSKFCDRFESLVRECVRKQR